MKESELYPYIKAYLEERNYEVKSEISDCDVLAYKNERYIAVEMKTALGMRLLAQAVKRQSMFDLVYIAIPKPKLKTLQTRSHQDNLRIVRRLNLGLLYVQTRGAGRCEEVFPPKAYDMRQSMNVAKKRREKAMKDFQALSGDHNIGGSTGVRRMTVYREAALLIALYLQRDQSMSAKQLRALGCEDNTWNILYNNHYGWFHKCGKGIYELTDAGYQALDEYHIVCDALRKTMIYEQTEN